MSYLHSSLDHPSIPTSSPRVLTLNPEPSHFIQIRPRTPPDPASNSPGYSSGKCSNYGNCCADIASCSKSPSPAAPVAPGGAAPAATAKPAGRVYGHPDASKEYPVYPGFTLTVVETWISHHSLFLLGGGKEIQHDHHSHRRSLTKTHERRSLMRIYIYICESRSVFSLTLMGTFLNVQ